MGPGKNVEDSPVIPQEEEPDGGSTKRIKSWNETQKDMSQ